MRKMDCNKHTRRAHGGLALGSSKAQHDGTYRVVVDVQKREPRPRLASDDENCGAAKEECIVVTASSQQQ
jgi:hypothetical protein